MFGILVKYVLGQTVLKVSNLYIAQVKKKYGLELAENFNLPKSENTATVSTRKREWDYGSDEAF